MREKYDRAMFRIEICLLFIGNIVAFAATVSFCGGMSFGGGLWLSAAVFVIGAILYDKERPVICIIGQYVAVAGATAIFVFVLLENGGLHLNSDGTLAGPAATFRAATVLAAVLMPPITLVMAAAEHFLSGVSWPARAAIITVAEASILRVCVSPLYAYSAFDKAALGLFAMAQTIIVWLIDRAAHEKSGRQNIYRASEVSLEVYYVLFVAGLMLAVLEEAM